MTTTNTKKRITRNRIGRFLPSLAIIGLLAVLTGGYVWSIEPTSTVGKTEMVVYKTPACSCCDKWVRYLQKNNFDVKVKLVSETQSVRSRVGVPQNMASCHTAIVGDYWVEGHVPADLIQKLLTEQPAGIQGIAAPGMPQGSPGMESPNPSTYKVLSVDESGQSEVYAIREGQNAH